MILTMLWKWLRGLLAGGGQQPDVLEAPKAPAVEAGLVDSSSDRNGS